MQVELSKEQLEAISKAMCYRDFDDDAGVAESAQEVIDWALSEIEELESIDLNECAGGACTL